MVGVDTVLCRVAWDGLQRTVMYIRVEWLHLTKLRPCPEPWPEGLALPACEGSPPSGGSGGSALISSAAINSKMDFRRALPCPKRCRGQHSAFIGTP